MVRPKRGAFPRRSMNEVRFLEARSVDEGPAAVVIQGAPYDGGVSYRAGARQAPYDVRVASDSIESYSHRFRRDLIDVEPADAGDISLSEVSADAVMNRIASATSALAATGAAVLDRKS